MKINVKILCLILILSFSLIFSSQKTQARINVTDWYIQDFETKIIVNTDSSLYIIERITADCGNAEGKHGIFRILPEQIKLENGKKIETPIKLVSITDFSGDDLKYTQTRDSKNETVTWKIGDANKEVKGVNTYQIIYKIKNAIRFDDNNFDEFYWNLNGNFWDIETDEFSAEIVFPVKINKENSEVFYYTGKVGEKNKDLALYSWKDNVLNFYSTEKMSAGEGITASVTFPKNIITPYKPTFAEKYGKYLFLLLPLFIFIICFRFWRKYGKDPKINKTIIAQYEIPDNLSPIELGMLKNNGIFKKEFLTAEIIYLASRGLIKIKEIENKILLIKSKDYEFTKTGKSKLEKYLNKPQKSIYEGIFTTNPVKLSSLKNKFYITVNEVKKEAFNLLVQKNLVSKKGKLFRTIFVTIGITIMITFFDFAELSPFFSASLFLSGIILFLFAFIMPKRTEAGAQLNWKIKGFELFMKTVNKDRAKFYEKENIFEKFLPYAIVFEMTNLWIKRMKEIYGEEYFNSYTPIWYTGNVGNFNVDFFTSIINDLSSSIAANTSSSSGSGGGGFSGGGGGGGGGGGW